MSDKLSQQFDRRKRSPKRMPPIVRKSYIIRLEATANQAHSISTNLRIMGIKFTCEEVKA